MNGLPGMRGIIGNRQKIVMGSDATAMPVGLGVVSWNTETACPGIIAKIFIEGVILLAGNEDMVDRVGRIDSVSRHRCPHIVYAKYTGIEHETCSC